MAENPELPRSAAGPNSPWLIAVIVSLATFMEVLDTTIANVSLRYIAGSLAAGQDESTYIITSYLVSNAIILPISGWLSNVIGRKRFYMGCVALFTFASVMCALSSSLWIKVIRHGLIAAGRFLSLRIRIPDRPGELARLLSVLAGVSANVLDVEHQRTGTGLHLDEVEVELQLETRGAVHAASVLDALTEASYAVSKL